MDKKLFDMVYRWGRASVKVDYTAPAFQKALKQFKENDMENLTQDELDSLRKLVTDEIDRNVKSDDDAYNTHWQNILAKLTK